MVDADDGGLGHIRVAHGGVLQVDGTDPFTAGLDDVLGAVGDGHEAVFVQGRDVARVEPVAIVQNAPALALEVAAGDPVTAGQQVAEGHAVARQFVGFVVGDLQFHAIDHATLLGLVGQLFLERQLLDGPGHDTGGAQRAHLRHAPGMDHRDIVFRLEGADHGGRGGGTADDRAVHVGQTQAMLLHVVQQHQPDCRYARRHGDLLVGHQVIDRLAVQVLARQHQLGTAHGRGVGQAPGIGVEHRHDRQDGVA